MSRAAPMAYPDVYAAISYAESIVPGTMAPEGEEFIVRWALIPTTTFEPRDR